MMLSLRPNLENHINLGLTLVPLTAEYASQIFKKIASLAIENIIYESLNILSNFRT